MIANRIFVVGAAMLGLAALCTTAGCAGGGGNQAASIPYPDPVLPEWVSSPYVEGGMAQTECVPADAPMSVLKGKASTLARSALASELEARSKDLVVNVQKSSTTDGGAGFSEDFERVTKQIVDQSLTGSRAARNDYVTIAGEKQFCSMVVLSPADTQRMREQIFAQPGMDASASEEERLWREFMLKKTQEDLEQERGGRGAAASQ